MNEPEYDIETAIVINEAIQNLRDETGKSVEYVTLHPPCGREDLAWFDQRVLPHARDLIKVEMTIDCQGYLFVLISVPSPDEKQVALSVHDRDGCGWQFAPDYPQTFECPADVYLDNRSEVNTRIAIHAGAVLTGLAPRLDGIIANSKADLVKLTEERNAGL